MLMLFSIYYVCYVIVLLYRDHDSYIYYRNIVNNVSRVESCGNVCEETRQERICVDRVIMITIAESSH